jgi:hypothetical protein
LMKLKMKYQKSFTRKDCRKLLPIQNWFCRKWQNCFRINQWIYRNTLLFAKTKILCKYCMQSVFIGIIRQKVQIMRQVPIIPTYKRLRKEL